MKKENLYVVGEEFTVDFMKNSHGGKPVCRIDGIICFIDSSIREFINPASSWVVSIVSIHEKYMNIKPLLKVRTAKENKEVYDNLISKLTSAKKAKIKVAKKYPYRSFAELKEFKVEKVESNKSEGC